MVGWSSGHHIGVLRAGRPLRWGAKSLTLKIDCVEQPGCRSLDLQWKPGLSDDKKLRRWKLRGKGEKAGVEGAGCGFTFISSFFFVVCGYTKGVETQLSKLYLLVEFDEISKVFETKSFRFVSKYGPSAHVFVYNHSNNLRWYNMSHWCFPDILHHVC